MQLFLVTITLNCNTDVFDGFIIFDIILINKVVIISVKVRVKLEVNLCDGCVIETSILLVLINIVT